MSFCFMMSYSHYVVLLCWLNEVSLRAFSLEYLYSTGPAHWGHPLCGQAPGPHSAAYLSERISSLRVHFRLFSGMLPSASSTCIGGARRVARLQGTP